jgi:hypothetical protein
MRSSMHAMNFRVATATPRNAFLGPTPEAMETIPSPPMPLFTLRCAPRGAATQNSGPGGSLLLSRKTAEPEARFIPAH